ncbi:MAG: Rrf2 family transcriptional regulator [Rhodocyclaceae bacterium]|nr:Rrf2 family transcriptional regulator [Zoogloeaceae bacterium]MCP5255816.1 Rrf2 family transcriptional regulator [Zoogloeaceae bacterium]MCW5615461.1 Rrf2 family transcriptional regulator [Rhodocyclaceae bacterium]
MRLTVYTDYTLRVLMYLSLRHESGALTTIEEIAGAYDISRNHLMKIVHQMGAAGLLETVRGRSGGVRLARAPEAISIGMVVRIAEGDFALVECFEEGKESCCAISPACNLTRGLRRALDAFMLELDRMTLRDAVASPSVAASLLGIDSSVGRRIIPLISSPAARGKRSAG